MPTLFLLRHLKSQWNLEDRFTGWVDVPLAKEGLGEVEKVSEKIFESKIDKIYSSPLIRNTDTVLRILENQEKYPIFRHLGKGRMQEWGKFEELDKNYIPVYISEALNERYYGKLQGKNKQEAMKKYGFEQVKLWRRSYKTKPPGGESLADTFKRTEPFYKKYIEKDLQRGQNVLVVASHNSLRSIAKYIEKISDEDILNYEIPFGGCIKYEFGPALKLKNRETM